MSLIAGANVSAQFFNTEFGIASGPQALLGLTFFNSLVTPVVVIEIFSISLQFFLSIGGSGELSSVVNTDWNCFTSILALDLLSLNSVQLEVRCLHYLGVCF